MRYSRLKSLILPSLLLFGGLFFLLIPSSQAATEPLVVRVGLYDNKPKLWQDENGMAQGLFPDTMNAIAEMEGWDIEYVYGTWDEGLARLETNEIDLMPDVAVSDERRQRYDFNEETVLVNWGVAYSRTDIDIDSIRDLENKRIAILKSGIHYDGPYGLRNLLTDFRIEAEIIDVKEYAEIFEILDRKEADVGIVNRVFGVSNESDYSVKRTSIIFDPTELRFALTKDTERSGYLIDRIDANLRQMKNDYDSAYHGSLIRHFGGITREVEVLPRWFKYLVSALLVLAIVIFGYTFGQRIIRKRLETLVEKKTASLKKEREQFKSIFESSVNTNLLIDAASLKIIDCNLSAVKLIKVSGKEDLIGKNPAAFSAPTQLGGLPTQEVVKGLATKVFTEGGLSIDWVLKRADGTEIFTILSLTPLEWRNDRVVYASLNDVSARKTAEAALAASEAKYRLLTENIPDALFVADAGTRKLIDCNESAVRLIGRPKEEILSMNADDLHPKDLIEETMKGFKQQAEGLLNVVNTKVMNKAGKGIPVEVNSVPFDLMGRKCLLGVFRDITEQKLAEEKTRAQELLKSRFITILTHITRTPLNRIRWSLESLESGEFGRLKKEGGVLVRQALDSNNEILHVIANMNLTLDIERGALTLERAPTSLESLVNSVADYFLGLPECQDADCTVDMPDGDMPAVDMDAEKMRQVIYGLIDNSRRFMKENDNKIVIRVRSKDGQARFSVEDTGIGIPEAEQLYIFGRFFRASNAMTKYPDGMGLGLYIAKAIVEKHGGRIGFESEEGKGSTFWFELPAKE